MYSVTFFYFLDHAQPHQISRQLAPSRGGVAPLYRGGVAPLYRGGVAPLYRGLQMAGGSKFRARDF